MIIQNTDAIINAAHLEAIYTTLRKNSIKLSKSEAAKIVGGRYVLEKLVALKKIRMTKPTEKNNGKWFCNAEDVLRYANYKKTKLC